MLTVLNAVRHPRMYHKEAKALAEAGFEVVIIGQGDAAAQSDHEHIELQPLSPFGRRTLRRLFAPFILLRKALKTKAEVYHLHAPELLLIVPLLRLLTKARIVYDMHEDYHANLQAGVGWPWPVSSVLAWSVRVIERLMLRALSLVIYAEESYYDVLNAREKALVVRNKHDSELGSTLPFDVQERLKISLSFLYSGTIAETWGIWRSLRLFDQIAAPLREQGHNPLLIIAGYAPDAQTLKRLRIQIERRTDILLIGGEAPVAPELINGLVQATNFGMAFYENTPRLTRKVPTKLYSYRYHQRPLLYTDCANWRAFFSDYRHALPVKELDIELHSEKLTEQILLMHGLSGAQQSPDLKFAFSTEKELFVQRFKQLATEHQSNKARS